MTLPRLLSHPLTVVPNSDIPPNARFDGEMVCIGHNEVLYMPSGSVTGSRSDLVPPAVLSVNTSDMTVSCSVLGTYLGSKKCPPLVRIGGEVYMFGGMTLTGRQRVGMGDLHVFNIATREFRQVPASGPWPEGRWSHAGFEADGRLLIAGGSNRDNKDISSVWAYDVECGRWTQMPDLPQYPFCPSCTTVGGMTHIQGMPAARRQPVHLTLQCVFDTETFEWRCLPPTRHPMITLAMGPYLVTMHEVGYHATQSVFAVSAFDTVSEEWQEWDNMGIDHSCNWGGACPISADYTLLHFAGAWLYLVEKDSHLIAEED
ncbi:hypothetical protein KIPB_012892 [Kipferlia bialata]|uniref:Kelch-type beta propeller n=1 Tax=Kipferlia bialata TaxID=797122 RepID=A0A391NRK5_9EUKA|nr:hypothetical protein KIPB_012892 [Kipferlia bialata]|eukprot:g12892.t1